MNFNRHEFFRTVSDSCFKVNFISGGENHQSHDNLSCFAFSNSIKLFFMALKSSFFEFFRKLLKRNSVMESIFSYTQVWGAYTFFGNFLEFLEQIISRTTVNNSFWTFWYFFSELFSRSIFWFGAIYCSLVLCEKLWSILKYYFKYVNFVALTFPNIVKFDRFEKNQYQRNFPFRVNLGNLIPAKKFFLIHLQKLILD